MTNEQALALFAEEHLAALRAGIVGGNVPRGEITLGIALTAIENGAIATVFGNNFCLAFGTLCAKIAHTRFCEAALGITSTSIKTAKLAGTENHIATTLFSSANPANVIKNISYVSEPMDQELVAKVREIIGDQIRVRWKNS